MKRATRVIRWTDREQCIRSIAPTATPPTSVRLAETTTRLTEHKRATRKGDVNNHIAEHHRLTNHTIDWDSAQCLTYSTNYFQRLTLESWFTNLEQTPLNRRQPYRHHTNDSFTTLTLQTNRTERLNVTNWSRPINHDWPTPLESYSQNITTKLTNQFIQTRLSTFDWQQPFTWLWWWLPLRLSKRQSPLPTTVFLRTTLTRTIKLHYYITRLSPGLQDRN